MSRCRQVQTHRGFHQLQTGEMKLSSLTHRERVHIRDPSIPQNLVSICFRSELQRELSPMKYFIVKRRAIVYVVEGPKSKRRFQPASTPHILHLIGFMSGRSLYTKGTAVCHPGGGHSQPTRAQSIWQERQAPQRFTVSPPERKVPPQTRGQTAMLICRRNGLSG